MSFLASVPEPLPVVRRVVVGSSLTDKSGYHLDRRYPNQAHKPLGFHLEGTSCGSCLEAGTWGREEMLKLGLGVSQQGLWFGDPAPCSSEEEGAVK